jgi:non-ribosomal peptide synthetase component F
MPKLLVEALDERKITTIIWAVSALCIVAGINAFKNKVPQALKKVLFSGEVMPIKMLNIWKKYLPEAMYVNLYGPTEVTVDCTYFVVEEDFLDFEAVPIGKACANMEVLLLDENLSPVKNGEPGEICVRGTGLASGYYNSPEKTSKAFVKNPERPYNDYIYKTGDIGILREDGNIVFQARGDSQIKHLGYRIELGEIERALASIDKIKEAICFYDTENSRIVCVYEGECDKSEIVSSLSQIIPKYMLPNVYRKVPVMPHNQNSKIDRVKLKKEYDDEKNN